MTFPIQYPRFKVQHLIDYLEPLLQSGCVLTAGRLPVSQPNRAIGIVAQGGRPLEMEYEIDNPTYMIQCRGGADNFSDAEDIAYEVDSVILQSPTNFEIADGVTIDQIIRASGAPAAAPITDAQSRWVFQCQYTVRTFTNF